MKTLSLLILLFVITLNGCSTVRKSAGVERKSIDEFRVVENPPLVIPPDFSLLPPNQLEQKNIDDLEKELAKEILFGLEENETNSDNQSSTISAILSQANSSNVSLTIREEIDQEFALEKTTNDIFQTKWENEIEVIDAIKESECQRNKKFEGQSITECNTPTKIEKVKIKKKKRFFFF